MSSYKIIFVTSSWGMIFMFVIQNFSAQSHICGGKLTFTNLSIHIQSICSEKVEFLSIGNYKFSWYNSKYYIINPLFLDFTYKSLTQEVNHMRKYIFQKKFSHLEQLSQHKSIAPLLFSLQVFHWTSLQMSRELRK